jgi:hypothetical protein
MPRASQRFRRVALAAALTLAATASLAAQPINQVLLLQSSARGSLIFDHFTANLRVDLESLAANPLRAGGILHWPSMPADVRPCRP